MALLSVSERKRQMKELGYEYTREGIRKLQKKYFTRSKDIDGKYGKNTDILVRHCYNVQMYAPHFKPQEFKCGCEGKYCTGYPTYMKKEMLVLLEAIRTLPEEKRKAIMLYYFEGMTDVEIGKLFNTSRSTIQYRRTSSFELLKKYLEGHADEWEEW